MAKHGCNHEGCGSELPDDEAKAIPPGWTVALVEEYKQKTIARYFIYICPNHTLVTAEKQTSLFEEGQPT